jgi:HEAT repeat protein
MGESLSLTLSARLEEALLRQRSELETDYATTNLPLTSLIDDSTDPQVFRAAADLLADPRVDRRILGARILREIKTNRAEAGRLVHEQIGRESDEDVLLWLVSALVFLQYRPALETLASLVHHLDPEIRYTVASALSSTAWPEPDERTTSGLLEMTHDPSPDVRFSALFELAEWRVAGNRDTRIGTALREHLAYDDPRVRRAVGDALKHA